MAKRRERLARKQPPEPRSLSVSLPSARSLGRTIGALQRELDGAIRRFNAYTARRRNPARQDDASAPSPRRPPRAAAVIRRSSATPTRTASAAGAVRASRETKRAARPK
jgi:hypothetical protein